MSALKEMTIQIGNHVKEDNTLLDGMVRRRAEAAVPAVLVRGRAFLRADATAAPRPRAARRGATLTARVGCWAAR